MKNYTCIFTFTLYLLSLLVISCNGNEQWTQSYADKQFAKLLRWEKVLEGQNEGANWFLNATLNENLQSIFSTCSKSKIYTFMSPTHKMATWKLANILMGEKDVRDVIHLAAALRDHSEMNSKLWLDAVVMAKLRRRDMAGLRTPSLLELSPDLMISLEAVANAKQSNSCIVIDGSLGEDNGLENNLWYWREDLFANSGHWYWHEFHSQPEVRGDRRGELFYHLHHEFIARYQTERLALGMQRTTPLVMEPGQYIPEGFDSHLTESNSLLNWTARPPNRPIPDIWFGVINLTVAEYAATTDQIEAHIQRGFLSKSDGTWYPLTYFEGIDILGDTIEATEWSINHELYSQMGVHNDGHVLLCYAAKDIPLIDDVPGVLCSPSTSMRDPIFYRYHITIDDIFVAHKFKFQPYGHTMGQHPLLWSNVQILSLEAIPVRGEVNQLTTHWTMKNVTLPVELDLLPWPEASPTNYCVTHLNHVDFQYNIELVANDSSVATVRIFLAPRYNEAGHRFSIQEQHRLFFTLDMFSVNLTSGLNHIVRHSKNSSVTAPAQTWVDLEEGDYLNNYCGCGWPQHLLLPKGASNPGDNAHYDLFVMITNDEFEYDPEVEVEEGKMCRMAPVLCGTHNKPYPDKTKPMGYPFDRKPASTGTLDEFMENISNMKSIVVRINHENNL